MMLLMIPKHILISIHISAKLASKKKESFHIAPNLVLFSQYSDYQLYPQYPKDCQSQEVLVQ